MLAIRRREPCLVLSSFPSLFSVSNIGTLKKASEVSKKEPIIFSIGVSTASAHFFEFFSARGISAEFAAAPGREFRF
jgi:hypothetical protein